MSTKDGLVASADDPHLDQGRADHDWRYASKAMAWYGWGSPVGIGLLILMAAAAAVLLRFAVAG